MILPVYLKAGPSIIPKPVCNTNQTDLGWMLNIVKYLHTGEWRMDIVGPSPIITAQKKFLLVATDYFSKWVEAEAYASIKDKDVSKLPTGVTPFTLAYRMEAIIPTEIDMPTVKTTMQDQRDNDEELIRQLNWADELREDAAIRIASYHQMELLSTTKRARPWFFRLGSLVLIRVFKNTTEVGTGKLQSN
ncbi:hypothetical protein CK203_091182 [Vitis vinifera]|uniref:Integrase catalytic domain-containing protein n=1 Tax=Vitis vinifera TaxID=29760 RepID=A0A438EYA3_VITVI|nr:hypothetical protein CK203_091182 [Vitis vinifera]